jgi:uncharacterized membrane protein YidH (DUF202 family)
MSRPAGEGLQAERTALAWSRTSLAFLVNGALLMLRNPRHFEAPLSGIAAGLAGIIAVAVYLVGVRRQRTLARRPLPARITANAELQLVGVAVPVLIVATALGLYL